MPENYKNAFRILCHNKNTKELIWSGYSLTKDRPSVESVVKLYNKTAEDHKIYSLEEFEIKDKKEKKKVKK